MRDCGAARKACPAVQPQTSAQQQGAHGERRFQLSFLPVVALTCDLRCTLDLARPERWRGSLRSPAPLPLATLIVLLALVAHASGEGWDARRDAAQREARRRPPPPRLRPCAAPAGACIGTAGKFSATGFSYMDGADDVTFLELGVVADAAERCCSLCAERAGCVAWDTYREGPSSYLCQVRQEKGDP